MSSGHYGFFSKDGGEIVKAPLIKWASYRKRGYAFSTEEEYNAQRTGVKVEAPAEDDTVELPTMDDNKATILAFAKEHEVDVDPEDTKAALLDVIEGALT